MVTILSNCELRIVGAFVFYWILLVIWKLIRITFIGLQSIGMSWILFSSLIVARSIESQIKLSYLQGILDFPPLVVQAGVELLWALDAWSALGPVHSRLSQTNRMLLRLREFMWYSRWTDEDRLDLATHFVVCSRFLDPRLSCVLLNRIEPLALLVDLASLSTLHIIKASLWHNIEVVRRSQLVWSNSDRVMTLVHTLRIEGAWRRKLIANPVDLIWALATSAE